MSLQIIRREYPLRAHLVAFGLAAFLPMTILAGFLLVRSAAIERAELEARLLNVAENLAADLDRELSNLITTLNTLASAPALRTGDLAAFHAQASAAVSRLGGAIFLVDPDSLQQVLNTLVPWGTQLPRTGDAKSDPCAPRPMRQQRLVVVAQSRHCSRRLPKPTALLRLCRARAPS